jgi:hypothetical protein
MNKSEQLSAEKQLMLDEWKSSGQRISSFCKERNIPYHSFFYWQKKLSSRALSMQNNFLELTPSPSQRFPLTEIIYPNGKRIVFHSPVEVCILKQLAE